MKSLKSDDSKNFSSVLIFVTRDRYYVNVQPRERGDQYFRQSSRLIVVNRADLIFAEKILDPHQRFNLTQPDK